MKPLVQRYPYLDEYFSTVAWKNVMAKLAERRPLIFIMVNTNKQVTEVMVKEESEMQYVERMGRARHTDHLTQKVATALAPKTIPKAAAPKKEPEVAAKEAPVPTVESVVEAEILKEAISDVAVAQGNEGVVAPGRWVEFLAGKEVKQGKILEVSDDELFFTISTRDGQVIQVDAAALQSLIPEII